jgi:Fic family protein
MKREEFSHESPGELVAITGGFAFVPNHLPPPLNIDWEFARELDRAGRSLAKLDGQASLIQNKALIIRPLATREAMLSARLEGTHTHVEGVLLQEVAGPARDPIEASNNQEVVNYLQASTQGERWLADGRPINSFLLRSLHEVLLRRTRGEKKSPGSFRQKQVLIGAHDDSPETARFVPPPPEQVPPAIENLVDFITVDKTYPPLIAAGIAHYQFETIHPFEDGNGRLGRLFIPLQLMATDAITYPLLYLSPFFEGRREEYLQRLKDVSIRGAWSEWLRFFLEAVYTQAEDARSRVERILALHDHYRVLASQQRSKGPLVAVDLVMVLPLLTVADVQEQAQCSYHAAKRALDVLTDLGIVRLMPPSHPQRWIAQELIDAVYDV